MAETQALKYGITRSLRQCDPYSGLHQPGGESLYVRCQTVIMLHSEDPKVLTSNAPSVKLPGKMNPSHREEPLAAEHSRATKRKHSPKSEEFHSGNIHAKCQRLTVSQTLTISETKIQSQTFFARKPEFSRNPPTSNRFERFRSSRKRNKTWKRRKSSATDECHRQWTFSSRDFSNFKGINFKPFSQFFGN